MPYKDPEQRKRYFKKWSEDNREHYVLLKRQHHEKNPEHERLRMRRWYEKNRQHHILNQRKRRQHVKSTNRERAA